MPSSPCISQMRSDSSPRDDTRASSGAYFSYTAFQSQPDIVGRPEVIALQAPHFAQDLPPLGARLDGGANAVEIDPSGLARRRVRLRRRIARVELAVGRHRAQPLAVAHDERQCDRSRARSARPSRRSTSVRSVSKSKSSSRPGRLLVAAASVRADDGHHGPDDLAAGDRRDLPELVLGYRERATRRAMPVEIHANGVGVGALVAVHREPRRRLRLHALERRIERRRAAVLQCDEIRPRRARERELELHGVVHGIERAHRQEVEVLAGGVERRRVVAELRLRDERRRLRLSRYRA